MGPWQVQAAAEMKDLLNKTLDVRKIDLKGSLLNPDLLDLFSDVDMEIHLHENPTLDITHLVKELSEHYHRILGYETHSQNNQDVLRLCFENGQRFDLVFIYEGTKKPLAADNLFEANIDSIANQFWFTASTVLTKLRRKDYLVAAHLALELCQLVVVIQMLIRDKEKSTNIHRFGDAEVVPVLNSLIRLNDGADSSECSTPKDILDVLYLAADYMDKVSEQLGLGCLAKGELLRAMG